MNEPFTIRQFQPDDIKQVVSVNLRCLPENYPDQFFMGLFYHAPEAFFVAEHEGEVIGYTILKFACGGREEQAKRMRFSTLTTEELREAYTKADSTINFRLVAAGETRHIVDFLWGINLSRALTLAVKNTRPVSLISPLNKKAPEDRGVE